MVRSSRYARFATYVQCELSGHDRKPRQTSFLLPNPKHIRGKAVDTNPDSAQQGLSGSGGPASVENHRRSDAHGSAVCLWVNLATKPDDAHTRRVARRHRGRQ